MSIITECPTCDHPVILEWEGGKHGWFPHLCEQCKAVMWVEATRIGGETLSSSEFFARIVKPEDQERVRAYCVAVSVDAVQFTEKHRPAETLANALKLDMQPRWSAGDDYLSRISAAQINSALLDAGKADFTGHQLKKSELVAKAKPLLKTWLPKLLRFGSKS